MTSGANASNSDVPWRILGRIRRRPVGVDVHVAAGGPTQKRQSLQKRTMPSLKYRIVRYRRKYYADAPHAFLLRARSERPRRRAAEQYDELAPFHVRTLPRPNFSLSLT